MKFSLNQSIFAENLNYLNNYTITIYNNNYIASRIVRQPNDSPGSPLSICAFRVAVSLIL